MKPEDVAVYIQTLTAVLMVMKFINVILVNINDFKLCVHSLKMALSC
jgi:hypothetical protein